MINNVSVEQYLHEIGRTPLLKVPEEQEIARHLSVARRRLLCKLLENEFILRGILSLADGILKGKTRLDRLVEVNQRNIDQRRQAIAMLSTSTATVAGLLERNASDRQLAAELPVASQQRRSLRIAIRRRQRKASRLFAEAKIRLTYVDARFEIIEGVQRKMLRLEARIASVAAAPAVRRLRRKLRRLTASIGVPPRRLRRFFDEVSAAREEYVLARARLTNPNLRLVVPVAKRYSGSGQELLDLIQEGNLGLLRAADRFDVGRGTRFSTYAVWWIRQSVSRAVLDKGRTVRLTAGMLKRINGVQMCLERTSHEIANRANLGEAAAAAGLSAKQAEDAINLYHSPLSLDESHSDDERCHLAAALSDQNGDNPDRAIDHALLKTRLGQVFMSLNPRERQVIRLRYGFADGREWTLQEIGEEIFVTRERVRQIAQGAMRKLRESQCVEQLSTFLDGSQEEPMTLGAA